MLTLENLKFVTEALDNEFDLTLNCEDISDINIIIGFYPYYHKNPHREKALEARKVYLKLLPVLKELEKYKTRRASICPIPIQLVEVKAIEKLSKKWGVSGE